MDTKGLKRNTIDKYYTKPSTVDLCISKIREHISIHEDDMCVEPSAGDGSFIDGIKTLCDNYIFLDIEPEGEEIVRQDYLDYVHVSDCKKTHVIGNPPFGRQSSLAIKFIKKSCEYGYSISFILPKSFKKDSMKRHFPRCFHLIYETDLPFRSFLVNGDEHDVPCVFQIWERKSYDRPLVDKLDPINFIFVSKDANPDISVRRVGVNAGKIDTDTEKSEQSHYFIQFTNGKPVDDNLDTLSGIVYTFNNTVGPRSISKQELIFKFNPCLA